jgi:hypothetical protein
MGAASLVASTSAIRPLECIDPITFVISEVTRKHTCALARPR